MLFLRNSTKLKLLAFQQTKQVSDFEQISTIIFKPTANVFIECNAINDQGNDTIVTSYWIENFHSQCNSHVQLCMHQSQYNSIIIFMRSNTVWLNVSDYILELIVAIVCVIAVFLVVIFYIRELRRKNILEYQSGLSKYEFPASKLKKIDDLGSGQYGIVSKEIAYGILPGDNGIKRKKGICVAVKTMISSDWPVIWILNFE